MKKLFVFLAVALCGLDVQAENLTEFVCANKHSGEVSVFVSLGDHYYSNVIEFNDSDRENFKKLLNVDEAYFNIQKLEIKTAGSIDACAKSVDADKILECKMTGKDGWAAGHIAFKYFHGPDLISVERNFEVLDLKLNVAKTSFNNPYNSEPSIVAVLNVQMKILINDKEVEYTLSRKVGSFGSPKATCTLR